jgi:hypothetical protein
MALALKCFSSLLHRTLDLCIDPKLFEELFQATVASRSGGA